MDSIKPGVYQHFKGGTYEVTGIAYHSETEEPMVLYKPLYGDVKAQSFWVRPLQMFLGNVEIDGDFVPRFHYLKE